jgi:hypothetical protein
MSYKHQKLEITMARERLFNTVLFWLAAAVLPCLCLLYISKVYGPVWFLNGLLIYGFVYRPIVVVIRLLSLKAIEKKDAWRVLLPFWAKKYFKIMWLG